MNTAIGRDVTEALAGYDIPTLAASVSQRVAFAESAAQGQTVLETDPTGIAAQEVLILSKEIQEKANEQEGIHRNQATTRRAARGR